jgi:hypothetical protein
MAQTHSVSTFDEYMTLCNDLIKDSYIVFRGQTKDYPQLLPSLFRLSEPLVCNGELVLQLYVECFNICRWDKLQEAYMQRVREMFGTPIGGFHGWNAEASDNEADWSFIYPDPDNDWRSFGCGLSANYDRSDFVSSLVANIEEKWDIHIDALLQHYGVPSRALDVSYEPVIALWFATHQFMRDCNGSAKYIPIKPDFAPVVYAFSPGARVEDLRKINSHPYDPSNEQIPYYGLRGVAQCGGLLFGATTDQPDMRQYVSHIIHTSPSIWDTRAPGSHTLNEEDLFPRKGIDSFYSLLLKRCEDTTSKYSELTKYVPVYG